MMHTNIPTEIFKIENWNNVVQDVTKTYRALSHFKHCFAALSLKMENETKTECALNTFKWIYVYSYI
jgi:quinol monooxygenase YgiN